jgi:hypothetical protein
MKDIDLDTDIWLVPYKNQWIIEYLHAGFISVSISAVLMGKQLSIIGS